MAAQVGLLRRLRDVPHFLLNNPAKIFLSGQPGGEDPEGMRQDDNEKHFPPGSINSAHRSPAHQGLKQFIFYLLLFF